MLRDGKPVVDVAVGREAGGVERRDRLAGELERDRLVEEELAARRLRDDRALVADDRVGDSGRSR